MVTIEHHFMIIKDWLSVTFCPNPKFEGTEQIEVFNAANYNADVEFETLIQWKCKDRRYLIRKIGATDEPVDSIEATCTWYKNYTILSSELGTNLYI